jgi:hypothetical protein
MKIGGASAMASEYKRILHQRMGKGGIREQQRARGHCLQADRGSIAEVKRIERRSLDSKIFK